VHPPPEGGALSPELRGRRYGIRLSNLATSNERNLPTPERMRAMTTSTAYFATGCFWGAERRFWKMAGVITTSVGYMGGTTANPSYEEICTGRTGHAEMVKVEFDTNVISYQRLLEEFWTMHDPTSLNAQGGDIGTQYRSSIYTTSAEQMETALATRSAYQSALSAAGMDEIVTEILSAENTPYYLAEEYHQRYLEKNPNGYDCHSSTGITFPKLATK
jgi:peptide-methionine (S)-S-oxide reductase